MIRQTNILQYLEHDLERYSEKVCFADDQTAMTFGQVSEQARSIGSFLIEDGFSRQPIVVFMKRRPQAIVCFLGIVYAGCYYVPLDEEIPDFRVEMIFKTLQPGLVICDETTQPLIREASYYCGKIVCYDDICNFTPKKQGLSRVREKAIDTDPVYIVYTSGSTGTPKGVVACHRSVIDYIESFSEVMCFNEETVFGMQVPLYVDACLKEIYPTLKYKATTYLIPRQLFMFPLELVRFLNGKRINTICWVVSALTIVSGLGVLDSEKPRYLHTIAAGSEVFPIRQLNLWQEALPRARFIYLYGPTEATGMSCWYEIERRFAPDEVLPIGQPFQNTDVFLLTEDDQLALNGQPGEICIRGTSLTLGYINDIEQTETVFIQNPLHNLYPEMIYRTGDIGYVNEQGQLVFISRRDDQIKHMGHRIELAEIELVVNNIDGVVQSCSLFDEKRKKILLFYVGNRPKAEVIEFVKQKLPRHMVPNFVKHLAAMPLTDNGKINRQLLKTNYLNKKES